MSDLYISTDRSELDISLIHQFLSVQSSWAKGISRALVAQAIAHSLCFGRFLAGKQIAFARVISDYTTFANLVDVFRADRTSRQRLQQSADECDHGALRIYKGCDDSHSPLAMRMALYEQYRFTSSLYPETLMERYVPNLYAAP